MSLWPPFGRGVQQQPQCCHCVHSFQNHGCLYCTGFLGPEYWRADIAGIKNGACGTCDRWNGTYYLSFSSNINCFPVTENTSCCCWTAPDGADACADNVFPNFAGEYAKLTLQVCAAYDSFAAGIRVRMFHARTGGFFVFEKQLPSPISCRSISGLNIPLVPPSPTFCNVSNATCHLWAIGEQVLP